MGLVTCVNGQFDRKTILHVDMHERPFFAVFSDSFSLYIENHALAF